MLVHFLGAYLSVLLPVIIYMCVVHVVQHEDSSIG
jgi:hypothetical protein